MSYTDNVYYSPEKFGLETVGEIDITPPDYGFNILAVWREKETGDFYIGTDSGCSCPSPFEDFFSLADLRGPMDARHAVVAIANEVNEYSDNPAELISRVMNYS